MAFWSGYNDFRFERNITGGTTKDTSEAPMTMSFPLTVWPPIIELIAFPLAAVASITLAPPPPNAHA